MNQSGDNIHSPNDWFKYAPPAKGKLHWLKGRSAMELAKVWFRDGLPKMPDELSDLINLHPDTGGYEIDYAIPEYETKLDDNKGKGRNHDLIIIGDAAGKRTLIAIEAKVDETFGLIVSKYVYNSVKDNPRSKVPDRVRQLSEAILGTCDTSRIRYQLIHAIAGTLIEAKNRGAVQAVFIVHEFVPIKGRSIKAVQNDHDYSDILKLLCSNKKHEDITEALYGPLSVPGGGYVPSDIPLDLGKITSSMNE
jgi:hypothetical protein